MIRLTILHRYVNVLWTLFLICFINLPISLNPGPLLVDRHLDLHEKFGFREYFIKLLKFVIQKYIIESGWQRPGLNANTLEKQ